MKLHEFFDHTGGAHASRHDGEGPGRHSATYQRPLPSRIRKALSPITPCVPPGQPPGNWVGQEVVLCRSRGWHCRSFVIVAIMNYSVAFGWLVAWKIKTLH